MRLGVYGSPNGQPSEPGDAGEEGGRGHAVLAAGNGGKRGGRHGRRPWPAELAAKAQEANKTRNKLLGEIEGRTAKLTKGEMETEEAVRAEGRSTELGDLGATAAAFLGARQT